MFLFSYFGGTLVASGYWHQLLLDRVWQAMEYWRARETIRGKGNGLPFPAHLGGCRSQLLCGTIGQRPH